MIFDLFVSALVFTFIYTNPLIEKTSLIKKALLFISCFTCTYIDLVVLNTKITNLIFPYLQFLLAAMIVLWRKKSITVSLIGMILGYLTSVFINHILLVLINMAFDLDVESIYASRYFLFGFYFVYLILVYLTTVQLRRVILLFYEYKEKPFIFAIGGELTLTVALFIFNIAYGRTIGYHSKAVLFNCIMFVIFFLLSSMIIYLVITTQKRSLLNEQEKIRLQDLESYVSNLETANSTYRTFKHDYINILSTLRAYIYENKNDELKEYFENHIMQTQLILDEHSDTYSELSKIKTLPLKSILISKLNTAVVKNINFLIDVNSEFEISDKYIVDISTITAIFFDNALEATEKSEHPFIGLILSDYEDCTEIIIENSFENEDIDLLNIDNLGYSTKGDNRGTGLYNAASIIKNNPNLVVDTEIKNNIFTKTIILYKEK